MVSNSFKMEHFGLAMSYCPLCQSSHINFFCQRKVFQSQNDFFICMDCDLVFRDPSTYLNLESEQNRYLLHENDPEDENYYNYLKNILSHFNSFEGMTLLDYGCGPSNAVEKKFSKEWNIRSYDPIFFPNLNFELFENKFDSVFCCECVEHFYYPKREWERIQQIIKVSGQVLIKTGWRQIDRNDKDYFINWHYPSDPTHVNFYSLKTFNFLKNEFFNSKNVKLIGVDLAF